MLLNNATQHYKVNIRGEHLCSQYSEILSYSTSPKHASSFNINHQIRGLKITPYGAIFKTIKNTPKCSSIHIQEQYHLQHHVKVSIIQQTTMVT